MVFNEINYNLVTDLQIYIYYCHMKCRFYLTNYVIIYWKLRLRITTFFWRKGDKLTHLGVLWGIYKKAFHFLCEDKMIWNYNAINIRLTLVLTICQSVLKLEQHVACMLSKSLSRKFFHSLFITTLSEQPTIPLRWHLWLFVSA